MPYELSRPPQGALLDRAHPLAHGLRLGYLLNEGGGGRAGDLTAARPLALKGGATLGGRGLVLAATGAGAEATLGAALQLTAPVTLAVKVTYTGTPSTFGSLITLTIDNADGSPYTAFAVVPDGSRNLGISWANGSGYNLASSSVSTASTVGTPMVLVATFAPGAQSLYLNGVSIASASAGTLATPSYAATALVALGGYTGTNRDTNADIEWAFVWDRVLSPGEVGLLASDPYGLARPRDARRFFAPPAWGLRYDGTFPGTTSAGTVTDTAATGTAGAWRDVLGSTWSNSGGRLYSSLGTEDDYAYLARPDSEQANDQRVTLTLPALADFGEGNTLRWVACVRLAVAPTRSDSTGYRAVLSATQAILWKDAPGGAVFSGFWSYTLVAGRGYDFTLDATGPAVTMTLVDLTGTDTIAPVAITDSSYQTGLQAVGSALATRVERVRTYGDSPPAAGGPLAAAAAASAVATLTGSASLSLTGSASPASVSTLTAGASLSLRASASPSAVSTLAGAAAVALAAAASPSAVSTLTASASSSLAAAASPASVSTLAGSASLPLSGSASASSVATLTADATIGGSLSAIAAAACVSTLTASASVALRASAAAASVATLAGSASLALGASASASAVATLTADATLGSGLAASSSASCVSTLTASATLGLSASASAVAVATLTADGSIGTGLDAAALASCVSTLTASATVPRTLAASAACVTTFTATATGGADLPVTFLEALRLRLKIGVRALTEVYRRESPPLAKCVTPFAIVNVVGEQPEFSLRMSSWPAWTEVQFSFFSRDDAEAERVRDLAFALFIQSPNNSPIYFQGGVSPPYGAVPGLRTEARQPGLTPGAQPVWVFTFSYKFSVSRAV